MLFTVTPLDLFNRAEHACSTFKSGAIEARIDSNLGGQSSGMTFRIDVKGELVTVRVLSPARGTVGASDRVFRLQGNQCVAYDAWANEKLTRPLAGKNILQRLSLVVGDVPEAVAIFLSPEKAHAMFSRYRQMGGFKLRGKDKVATTFVGPSGKTTSALQFGADGSLNDLRIQSGATKLHWSIKRSAVVTPYVVPSSARTVQFFIERPLSASYGNPDAQKLVELMLKTYRALTSLSVSIVGDSGASTVAFGPNGYRCSEESTGWSYIGRRLVVRRDGRWYAGNCSVTGLFNNLAALNVPIDPLVIQRLRGGWPYHELCPPRAIVKQVGAMVVNGAPSSIFQTREPQQRISFTIRDADHLLSSISSENLDGAGKVFFRSQRQFAYGKVKPIVGLTVPKDVAIAPLPVPAK